MVYVCIDTNIYINLLATGSKEFEEREKENEFDISIISEMFSEINFLSQSKAIKLLLPEVVILELKKQNKSFKSGFQKSYKILLESIKNCKSKIELWNETEDTCEKIEEFINKEEARKIECWTKLYNYFEEVFNSSSIDKILITPELLCKIQKRIISDEIKITQSNDALIIESIYDYCERNQVTINDEILFVTKDEKDFKKLKSISHSVYKIKYFYSLKHLHKYINFSYKIDIPKELEEKYEELNSKNYEFDDEDYYKEFSELEDERISKVNEEFEHKLQNESPQDLLKLRESLLKEIKYKLKNCRKTNSWCDRSESKLYRWIECRLESEIPYSKLSELIKINSNLDKYLEIHLENDEEISSDGDLPF